MPGGPEHRAALAARAETFETAADAVLYGSHARFDFWTWGDARLLPAERRDLRDARAATSRSSRPATCSCSPRSPARSPGDLDDADPAKRAAVRLTSVLPTIDPSGGLFADPPTNASVDVTEIAWDPADALPFPLCISVEAHPGLVVGEAWGNIVLADHGRTIAGEDLGEVPAPVLTAVAVGGCDPCDQPDPDPVPIRYRPTLANAPLTQARPAPPAGTSATGTIGADPRTASPAIVARGDDPRLDRAVDARRRPARLGRRQARVRRRGRDRRHRDAPLRRRRARAAAQTDTAFAATYRVGNGVAGNVGAGAIAHVATLNGAILGATNPIAAAGGTDPEPADGIRRDAPEAYLVQERAVTADDYASVSEREPDVQRAAATFRWTGSWYTVFVTADRVGGAAVDAPFETELTRLPRARTGWPATTSRSTRRTSSRSRSGCSSAVEPDYFRAHVKAAVLDVLSSGVRADGTLGLFHPDRFTFGTPVYLSAIVAAAQDVPGVQSVTPLVFQRQRDDATSALDTGVLAMGRLEIARLDDDPSFPEHGVLELTMGGGK